MEGSQETKPNLKLVIKSEADTSTKSNNPSEAGLGNAQKVTPGFQHVEIKIETEHDSQPENEHVLVKIEPLDEHIRQEGLTASQGPLENNDGLHLYPDFNLPLTSYLLERQMKLLKGNQAESGPDGTNSLASELQENEELDNVNSEQQIKETQGDGVHHEPPEKPKKSGNSSNGKGGICKVCNKYITRLKNMKLHMRTHTGERPYLCKMCNSRFSNASMLQIHIRTHTGEKPYECDTCKSRFTVKSHLRRHAKTHTGEKPFECSYCQARFINNSYLQMHLKTHTGEKPFVCSVCHKGFTRNSVLNRHLRSHTGEKPHSCNICQKTFADKSKLLVHSRIHTGEKPYECNICPSKFSDSSRLKVHVRTHTGEKPYECNVCQRPFADKSNLRSHMMLHTGEKKVIKSTSETKLISRPLGNAIFEAPQPKINNFQVDEVKHADVLKSCQ